MGGDGLANRKLREEMFSSDQDVRRCSEGDDRLGQADEDSGSDSQLPFSPQDGGTA